MPDEDDEFLHAADEPTAMWDEGSLRDLGLDAPLEQQESGPATTGTGAHRAIGVELTNAAAPPAKSSAMSWVITVVLAVVLGVGMFFLVRHLR